MARWIAHYGAETARAIARRQRPRAGARSHREERSRALGERARRTRAADRHGARAGAGPGVAAAGLRRGRLVGAGRRRRTAGAAARRRARPHASPISAPRPAARPRNWPPPAPASPRSTARRRGSSGCARISRGCGLTAETVAADVTRMAGRAVRRRPARRALLVDRHHPPPSRHPLAQARGRHRRAGRAAAPAAARAVALLKPGGTLVYCTCSLEPEEGERQVVRDLLAREPACAAGRSRPARSPASPNG